MTHTAAAAAYIELFLLSLWMHSPAIHATRYKGPLTVSGKLASKDARLDKSGQKAAKADALLVAQRSTASMGKFDRRVEVSTLTLTMTLARATGAYPHERRRRSWSPWCWCAWCSQDEPELKRQKGKRRKLEGNIHTDLGILPLYLVCVLVQFRTQAQRVSLYLFVP